MDQEFWSSAVAGEWFWKEVPNLSPIHGQEASAGIIRRGTPQSFSLSVETSHSQSSQELLEILTKLTGAQEKTPKSPKPSIYQQEQKAKLHLD